MRLTTHAFRRLSQRGMKPGDLATIMKYGTAVRDGFVLRGDDANDAIAILKSEMRDLERLRGRLVIVQGDAVVTAYRPSRRRQAVLLSQEY